MDDIQRQKRAEQEAAMNEAETNLHKAADELAKITGQNPQEVYKQSAKKAVDVASGYGSGPVDPIPYTNWLNNQVLEVQKKTAALQKAATAKEAQLDVTDPARKGQHQEDARQWATEQYKAINASDLGRDHDRGLTAALNALVEDTNKETKLMQDARNAAINTAKRSYGANDMQADSAGDKAGQVIKSRLNVAETELLTSNAAQNSQRPLRMLANGKRAEELEKLTKEFGIKNTESGPIVSGNIADTLYDQSFKDNLKTPKPDIQQKPVKPDHHHHTLPHISQAVVEPTPVRPEQVRKVIDKGLDNLVQGAEIAGKGVERLPPSVAGPALAVQRVFR